MQRRVTAQEARQRLGELLESVYYRDDEVIIERAGKPMGVVVSPARYRQIEQDRLEGRRLVLAMIRDMNARVGEVEPDEAERIANEAVAAVRREAGRLAGSPSPPTE